MLGQLGPDLIVESRKSWHDKADQEDEQSGDHKDQQYRIEKGGNQLFAEGKRNPLEGQIARENFFQIAGTLTGQQRSGVNHGKSTLRFEGRRKRLAGANSHGNILQLGAQGGGFLALCQQVHGGQDGKTSPNQRQKLLIKNQEWLQFDALARPCLAGQTLWLDPVDVMARLGETLAYFFGGVCNVHILLHVPPFIRSFDDIFH